MNQRIIDKIKKLLSLSSSPVQAEAELALRKAKELMEEYGVSIVEDKTESIIETTYSYEKDGQLNSAFQLNLISIASSLARYFHCLTFIRSSLREDGTKVDKPVLVGLETNVEVCKHALDCILHSLWFDYRAVRKTPQGKGLAFSENYWSGAASALYTRFRPSPSESKSEFGLILYDQIDQYLKEKYPKMGQWDAHSTRTNSRSGFSHGESAGNSAQLRSGVTSNSGSRKLIGN